MVVDDDEVFVTVTGVDDEVLNGDGNDKTATPVDVETGFGI